MRAARVPLTILVLAVAGLGLATGAGDGHPLSAAPSCPILPSDNPWNTPVDQLPVASDSAALIQTIGLDTGVHPDFGSGKYQGAPIGIPYAVVTNSAKKVPVHFQYSGESDKGPYPLPKNVPIEGGRNGSGDRHVIVVNRDTCTDYELFDAHPKNAGKSWRAGSGAIFNLRSDALRPAGWTSADAAGLPILPGLARYDDVTAGSIDHALRFTASCTAAAYVYPARHQAPNCSGKSNLPPMGLRVRLKASVDISKLPPQARVIAQAMKTYGMLLADNGSSWYVSGAPNPGWNNDDLHQLGQLTGRDFEVVDTSSLPQPGT